MRLYELSSKRKYELKAAVRAKEYEAACGSMSLRRGSLSLKRQYELKRMRQHAAV